MSLEKAIIKSVETGLTVRAWFNPETLSLSKNANWSEQPVKTEDDPIFQWTAGKGKQLSFKLFFDGYEEKKTVRGDCEQLLAMATMDGELHRPPKCMFTWGGGPSIEGVVLSVKVEYTMFLPSGLPVRATADVQMNTGTPIRSDEKNPKPVESKASSPDYEKLHTLRRGETLHAIAEEEYDDPAEWR
ncbi:MAG: hypothetical protein FJ125_14300, partial [Deltaproteobacteria bacterium]|nr:hypothetical protein [Deltaproteobacteria bacterium]